MVEAAEAIRVEIARPLRGCPVLAVILLEPGDLISTGTPGGVGNATGTYLQSGDRIEAWIDGIGTLVSPVVGE